MCGTGQDAGIRCARSIVESSEQRTVHCDVASFLQDVAFPIATSQVMGAERTF